MIKYPLASSTWDEKEIEAINGVIAKDMYTMGAGVKQFEEDFAKYVNSELGIFNSSLQILLIIKVLLAFAIASGVVYSLVNKVLKRTPHPIMKHFHKFVLVSGILIVILAKFMFTV